MILAVDREDGGVHGASVRDCEWTRGYLGYLDAGSPQEAPEILPGPQVDVHQSRPAPAIANRLDPLTPRRDMVKVVEPRLAVPALRSSAPLLGLLLVSCGSPTTTPSTPSGTPAAERVASGQGPAHTSRLLAAGVDIADVIDALFLGSGPDVAPNARTACPVQRVWTAFPRGTVVRVRVSSTVSPEARAAMRQALSQVTAATRGVVRAAIEETPELDPVPGTDEVTVSTVANPRAVGCRADSGCVQRGFRGRGILQSIRVVEPLTLGPVDSVRDVVGRGLLGMCQINGRRVAPAGGSLMSVEPGTSRGLGGLTPLDFEATRAVYGSTLEPGASRDDVVRAGLVHRHAGS